MRGVGPFETAPVIMVAVSGGRDSLALLRLMLEWAGTVGGSVVAATVDHDLRAGSAGEAERVAGWCTALGCAHLTLKWPNPHPELGAIQERARQARYALLSSAAQGRGILHLAAAHHADDQAETVLLRLCKGSGVDGLAGMSAIGELDGVRLIRPLLTVPAARLQATCLARGQDWIDDPSNSSAKFARVRVRQIAPILAHEGLSRDTLAATAARMGTARVALELETARLLARNATLYPQGYGEIDLDGWRASPQDIALRSLGQMLRTVGDSLYPARHEKLLALHGRILIGDFVAGTLGGCLVERSAGRLRIIPERRFPLPDLALKDGGTGRWGAFSASANCDVRVSYPGTSMHSVSSGVAASQPAFYDRHGLAAIPTLGYFRDGEAEKGLSATFSPRRPLSPAIFAIV